MLLTQLKSVVAAYLQISTASLTVDGVDMFLIAANNVKRNAENLHNFELTRLSATLDIDGTTGGKLEDANYVGKSTVYSEIKEINTIYWKNAGGYLVPLSYTRIDIPGERVRYRDELSNVMWPGERYPSDAQIESAMGFGSIVQRGKTLYVYPEGANQTIDPLPVILEAYGRLRDFTSADLAPEVTEPANFFLEQGASWLQWAIIIELNPLFQTFVPRQEGNPGPPTAQLESAWRDFILWDTYMIDSNSTRSR